MQRVFDIFFSTIAIIVFSPFIIAIILILSFTGEGEIL